MKKYNYEDIIKKGYLKNFYDIRNLERQINKLGYSIYINNGKETILNEEDNIIIQCYSEIIIYNKNINKEKYKKCVNYSSNRNQKCKRYAKKIKELLKNNCIFGTLTINDNYINEENAENWKKRLQRFFKKYNCKYICNVDYGTENERKHYHFIANAKKFNSEDWKYGYSYFEPIKNKKEFALSDYINKMTNHATKQTTKNYRIMCNF